MATGISAAPRERGAAAVEFALIAPLLIALVLGTAEFGWIFFNQANFAGAAREGAREMAISNNVADAKKLATSLAMSKYVTESQVQILPTSCESGKNVTVTIAVTYSSLTGWFDPLFGPNFKLSGTGVMRCGG